MNPYDDNDGMVELVCHDCKNAFYVPWWEGVPNEVCMPKGCPYCLVEFDVILDEDEGEFDGGVS